MDFIMQLLRVKKSNQISKSSVNPCDQGNECESRSKSEFLSSMPDQLLIELLIRLPSDCAYRYKAVCKSWFSLISSRYFVSRFIYQAPSPTPDTFTLLFQFTVLGPHIPGTFNYLYPVRAISNHPVLSKSYDSQGVDLHFLPRFKEHFYPNRSDYIVEASCHDLVLCYGMYDTYYVVNLLTKQWIVLPPLPIREQDRIPSMASVFRTFTNCRGKGALLCYHDEHNDDTVGYRFKVILIPIVRSDLTLVPHEGFPVPPELYASQFCIRIYCSKSKQWTDMDVDWYPLYLNAYLTFTPILYHKGMLHWLNGKSLVSIDHNPKLSHSVNLPIELSLKAGLCGFGVCQGHFRVAHCTCEETVGRVLYVWDLEDNPKGVWQLAHRVVVRGTFPRIPFKSVAFHPYNRDIIYVDEVTLVHKFNLRTRRLERYYKLKLERDCTNGSLRTVLPAILHQWFPTPVPSPVQD